MSARGNGSMTRGSSDRRDRPDRVVGFLEAAHLVSPTDRRVADLIEQANASGDTEGLLNQIEALVTQRLPPGVRLATAEEVEAPQREVRRLIRGAAKPLVARGWHRTETRLLFDAPNGY